MSDTSYEPAGHYDRVTDAWTLLLGEELHYGVFRAGDEPLPVATNELTNEMVRAARIDRGVEVLDVGCGTGAPACHLAGLGASVLGITTSAVGVAAAAARASSPGVPTRCGSRCATVRTTGYRTASFDRVVGSRVVASHARPRRTGRRVRAWCCARAGGWRSATSCSSGRCRSKRFGVSCGPSRCCARCSAMRVWSRWPTMPSWRSAPGSSPTTRWTSPPRLGRRSIGWRANAEIAPRGGRHVTRRGGLAALRRFVRRARRLLGRRNARLRPAVRGTSPDAQDVSPPSTTSVWPVMNPASGDTRKRTAATTSLTSPSLPAGVRRAICSRFSGVSPCVISVRR